LRTRTWEGQDGQKKSRVEVVASRVLFLGKQASAPLPNDESASEVPDDMIDPEDLPFKE